MQRRVGVTTSACGRTSLATVCAGVIVCPASAVNPPTAKAIANSVDGLTNLQALHQDSQRLTPLGCVVTLSRVPECPCWCDHPPVGACATQVPSGDVASRPQDRQDDLVWRHFQVGCPGERFVLCSLCHGTHTGAYILRGPECVCRVGCRHRCLDPVLTIAAGMSFRSPFLSPMDKRDEADAAKRYIRAVRVRVGVVRGRKLTGWVCLGGSGCSPSTRPTT